MGQQLDAIGDVCGNNGRMVSEESHKSGLSRWGVDQVCYANGRASAESLTDIEVLSLSKSFHLIHNDK